jgi:hypothetical protein
MGRVDVQDIDGCSTASRQADQSSPRPFEMSAPALSPGIKQDNDAAGYGVTAAEVAGFAQIALEARPCQVVQAIGPAVLLGDNVLDVKTQ